MKRKLCLLAAVLALILIVSGCNSTASEKIDLSAANYTVRTPEAPTLSDPSAYAEKDKTEIAAAIAAVRAISTDMPATAYVLDLSGMDELSDTNGAEEFLQNYFAGDTDIILSSELAANAIWGARTDDGMIDDIKALWINRFENADGDMEIVVDVSRNGKPLATFRYDEGGSGLITALLKSSSLAPTYDGREPVRTDVAAPEKTGLENSMFFRGQLHKTGILEMPVLGTVDYMFEISAKAVEGEIPGGFAGMLEGSVTIDGFTNTFTANANGIGVPVSLVDNPAEWYVGFSKVSSNNPQDKTGYRNVFLVKTDYSEVIGFRESYKNRVFNEWFEASRVTKENYDKAVSDNNSKLTSLYADGYNTAYGTRKEYNNLLAIVYNMHQGVNKDYLQKNLKPLISGISKDIRDNAVCYNDESVARLGATDMWFFPDGRSCVTQLFEYDGTSAIIAVHFTTKQDDGYGGLYFAKWNGSNWAISVLKDTRIKSQ